MISLGNQETYAESITAPIAMGSVKRGYNAARHTQNCKYRYISLLQTATFGIDLISTSFWAWVCFPRRFFIFIT